jgi:hypothetical protein
MGQSEVGHRESSLSSRSALFVRSG